MATMNVSLPDPLKRWVEDQVKGGQYANVSDYVRDLIRRDQQARRYRARSAHQPPFLPDDGDLIRRDQQSRQQLADLRAAIDLGVESGISPHGLDDVFAAARKIAKT